ncbi:unnamed protein product, partial [Iphiclides podalirius]
MRLTKRYSNFEQDAARRRRWDSDVLRTCARIDGPLAAERTIKFSTYREYRFRRWSGGGRRGVLGGGGGGGFSANNAAGDAHRCHSCEIVLRV